MRPSSAGASGERIDVGIGGRKPFVYDEADTVARGHAGITGEEKLRGVVAGHSSSPRRRTAPNKCLAKEHHAGNGGVSSGKEPARSGTVAMDRQLVYFTDVRPVAAKWDSIVDDELFGTVHARLIDTGSPPVHTAATQEANYPCA